MAEAPLQLWLDGTTAGHAAVALHVYRCRMSAEDEWLPAGLAALEDALRRRHHEAAAGGGGPPPPVHHAGMHAELLSYSEAADRLGRSRRTIERHVTAGRLVPVHGPGRQRRVRADDVDKLAT